ncbi:hypothetical protein J6590_107035, partial [Homalodisca vitripennis]
CSCRTAKDIEMRTNTFGNLNTIAPTDSAVRPTGNCGTECHLHLRCPHTYHSPTCTIILYDINFGYTHLPVTEYLRKRDCTM